jgi:hypothetical protein
MTIEELKVELAIILSEEERADADWAHIGALSRRLRELLLRNPPAGYPDVLVEEYLIGTDRRRDDSVFAHGQRSCLVGFLRS